MDDVTVSFVAGVGRCFADARVQASCRHSLLDMLAIVVLGVASGVEDFTDLELFGRKRQAWLRTFLDLPGGIPSHDTFRRVLSVLEPKEFAAGLFRWTQALHEATGGKLIAIDGKQVRTPTDQGGTSSGRGRVNGDRLQRSLARRCCTW